MDAYSTVAYHFIAKQFFNKLSVNESFSRLQLSFFMRSGSVLGVIHSDTSSVHATLEILNGVTGLYFKVRK